MLLIALHQPPVLDVCAHSLLRPHDLLPLRAQVLRRFWVLLRMSRAQCCPSAKLVSSTGACACTQSCAPEVRMMAKPAPAVQLSSGHSQLHTAPARADWLTAVGRCRRWSRAQRCLLLRLWVGALQGRWTCSKRGRVLGISRLQCACSASLSASWTAAVRGAEHLCTSCWRKEAICPRLRASEGCLCPAQPVEQPRPHKAAPLIQLFSPSVPGTVQHRVWQQLSASKRAAWRDVEIALQRAGRYRVPLLSCALLPDAVAASWPQTEPLQLLCMLCAPEQKYHLLPCRGSAGCTGEA